jgi:N-acetylmuramoyl-L-alanine amidase
MNIIQDFIPVGRRNRPGTKLTGPKYITIHDTANPSKGADALMHAKYLKGDAAVNRPASWHFTVDDERIVQHIPLDEVAWHAGDGSKGSGNTSSIAIEICENADGDRAKAEANAAELVAYLIRTVPSLLPFPECVVQHNRWSGKDCPRIIRHRSGGWEGFLAAVRARLETKKPLEPTPTPQNPAPADEVSAWAREARDWAVSRGITDGTRPKDPVTREEVWTMLYRALK